MDDSIEYKTLESDGSDVIALTVHGKLTGDDMAGLIERLTKIQQAGRKARLYVDLSGYAGYELLFVREKLANMRTLWKAIEKCAYVVDKAWMATMIPLIDAVTPMHLRAFGSDQEPEARAWLLSDRDEG
jgi:hypothetical protein